MSPEQIEKVRADFEGRYGPEPLDRGIDACGAYMFRWQGYLARARQEHAERQALEAKVAELRGLRDALYRRIEELMVAQQEKDRTIATLEARLKAMEAAEPVGFCHLDIAATMRSGNTAYIFPPNTKTHGDVPVYLALPPAAQVPDGEETKRLLDMIGQLCDSISPMLLAPKESGKLMTIEGAKAFENSAVVEYRPKDMRQMRETFDRAVAMLAAAPQRAMAKEIGG